MPTTRIKARQQKWCMFDSITHLWRCSGKKKIGGSWPQTAPWNHNQAKKNSGVVCKHDPLFYVVVVVVVVVIAVVVVAGIMV